ncbi:hypothetical protein LTR37_003937 [Vermiconidia calcicola]|uniref:Uncharacterized protein n=1 Tax=Vermiconidia calcicola TaxID=1690605 RepID=A0ACC3NNJ1_9PEZI|nr:hypothetical protein LTR37_003937 [Vermiconidia calcicola]
MTVTPSILVKLPTELIELIIDFVASPRALAALKQTCSTFDRLTEARSYESVLIANSKGNAFFHAMHRKPERRKRVHELAVDYDLLESKEGPNCSACSACVQASEFAELSRLEALKVRLGFWDRDKDDADSHPVQWEHDQAQLSRLFGKAGLAVPLCMRTWQSLTVWWEGILDFHELGGEGPHLVLEANIFLVASLQELTIRGCQFHQDDGSALINTPYRGHTALQRLHLEHSYIQDLALTRFLRMPRALTHLTLYHDESFSAFETGWSMTSPTARYYMSALRLQKHSLQVLRMNHEFTWSMTEGAFDFTDFPSLELLEHGRTSNEIDFTVRGGVETKILEREDLVQSCIPRAECEWWASVTMTALADNNYEL